MSDEDGQRRRVLQYFVEFVKFATGFAAIVAIALFGVHMVSSFIQ